MKQLLLLLLPTVTLASINLNLGGSVVFDDNPPYINGNINHEGSIERLVNDNDKVAFNIDEDELKNAIGRHHGKRPDLVLYQNTDDNFLNISEPGNITLTDIYERKDLKKVQIKIEPLATYLVDLKTEYICLNETHHENNYKQTMRMIFQRSVNITDSMTTLWSSTKVKGDSVNVKIDLKVKKDPAAMNHDFEFGVNDTALKKKLLHRVTTFRLQPNKTVMVRLIAKKGIVKFEIPYKISLLGDVIAGYNKIYKDKNFFSFSINEILQSNQRNTTIEVYQTVEYEFNYDVKLQIISKDGTVLKTVPSKKMFPEVEKTEDIGEKIVIKPAKSTRGLTEK